MKIPIDKKRKIIYDITVLLKDKKENTNVIIHVCELCGYEYKPQVGDPDNGIEANTDFEDLPEDWVCPLCGAGKEDFTEEEKDDDSDL